MKSRNDLMPAGHPPIALDAVDIALLLTYCTAWLAVIAAVALF